VAEKGRDTKKFLESEVEIVFYIYLLLGGFSDPFIIKYDSSSTHIPHFPVVTTTNNKHTPPPNKNKKHHAAANTRRISS